LRGSFIVGGKGERIVASDINHTINLLGMAQENFATCWYSSYRIALAAAGKGAVDVDAVLKGATIDVDEAKANGLKDTDFPKAANALSFTKFSGTNYNQKAAWYDVGLSDGAEAFLEVLRRGPLWVSRAGSKSKHIVVAHGYSSSGDKLWYANPWAPGENDAKQKWMEINSFVFGITNDSAAVQLHSSYS
jgi:hypothetical protein